MPGQTGPWSRESRLLLLTVGVCAVVLLGLARLRFPETPSIETSTRALERLAARASYEALAADIQRAESIIAPNVVVLRLAPQVETTPRNLWDALAGAQDPSGVRHVAALRTGEETAIAAMGGPARIDGIVGASGDGTAAVLGVDVVRGWARFRVPVAGARLAEPRTFSSLPTSLYVVVVEATQAGVTLRPLFLGRGDRFNSVKWSRPLVPLGAATISPGALLFSLDGEFLGAAVIEGGAAAVVGARDLLEVVGRLTTGTQTTAADLGLHVQPLTPELAAATGTPRGVVVAEVDPRGAAGAVLRAGDVLTAVGDRPATSPDDVLVSIATGRPGQELPIAFVRAGEARTAIVALGAAGSSDGAPAGIGLARDPLGTRIDAGPEPPIPGLRLGDVVLRAGDADAPTPTQLRTLLTASEGSGSILLIVRRDGRQRVVGVPHANRSHVASR